MARSVTKPEIAMLVGVGLAALLSAAFVEPFVAFGQLIGVFIWSAVIYGLVYVAYWVSQNREKVPERFHFLVVCSFVLSTVILFSDVLKAGQSPSSGTTKQTGDQQAAQQDALAKQDAEQQAAKAQEAQIRASLTDSAYMIKTAMNHTTAVTQLAALQTVGAMKIRPMRESNLRLLFVYAGHVFDPEKHHPGPNRVMIYLGAWVISGIRLAREHQINVRVVPTNNAICESVDLAHEIFNRVFRRVPESVRKVV